MTSNRQDGHARVLELAAALATTLRETPIMEHFAISERLFRNDPGVQALVKTLRHKAEEFQRAEREGSLKEEQLQEFREMQERFQSHPLLRNFQEARQAAGFLLKETNSIISQILGVDFGRTAGPASGGCC